MIKRIILLMAFCYIGCGNSEYPNYVTSYGLNIYLGQINKPIESDINNWTKIALDRWIEVMPEWDTCSIDAIKGVNVFFEDNYPIECFCGPKYKNILVKGYAEFSGNIYVGNSLDIKDRIFIHELGHIVALHCGNIWKDSDKFLKEIGYGY